ncbi:transcription regulator [Tanacetum coccineum]
MYDFTYVENVAHAHICAERALASDGSASKRAAGEMQNIVLIAFPRNMRPHDPSTPNLKIDLLAEISQSPRILSEVDAALKAKQMKTDVDEYLKAHNFAS